MLASTKAWHPAKMSCYSWVPWLCTHSHANVRASCTDSTSKQIANRRSKIDNPPMPIGRRPWQEELAIIDRTMKAISDVTDPETFVNVYYDNIGSLIPGNDYVSVSRRNVAPPFYLITRS